MSTEASPALDDELTTKALVVSTTNNASPLICIIVVKRLYQVIQNNRFMCLNDMNL